MKSSKKSKGKKKKVVRPKKSTCCGVPVVASSIPGCYIAFKSRSDNLPSWCLGLEPFSREDYGLREEDNVPDLSIDPNESTLTVINASNLLKCFYVSTLCDCFDRKGKLMDKGDFRDNKGNVGKCTTFVVLLTAQTSMELCVIKGTKLFSHISYCSPHPLPNHFELNHVISFPLLDEDGPFLCSQGHGGYLTHFTSSTHHAVDLECPEGTAVLAVGDAVVWEVRDKELCFGSWAGNLFQWNSIMLKLEDPPLYVEYVHIKTGSSLVKKGQKVKRGEKICQTGNIGFCPCPHLHIQCHTSDKKDAQTVRVAFEGEDGKSFFLECGQMYTSKGKVIKP